MTAGEVGNSGRYFVDEVRIRPETAWEYDEPYTVDVRQYAADLGRDQIGEVSFTFVTEPWPIEVLTGSAVTSGVYEDAEATIVYDFDASGSVTRTAGGQDAHGHVGVQR